MTTTNITPLAADIRRELTHVDPDDNGPLYLHLARAADILDRLEHNALDLALALQDAIDAGDLDLAADLRRQQDENTARWLAVRDGR